eukprot:scaffold128035_cov31-Tisochrysis_lutea.AAC.2
MVGEHLAAHIQTLDRIVERGRAEDRHAMRCREAGVDDKRGGRGYGAARCLSLLCRYRECGEDGRRPRTVRVEAEVLEDHLIERVLDRRRTHRDLCEEEGRVGGVDIEQVGRESSRPHLSLRVPVDQAATLERQTIL